MLKSSLIYCSLLFCLSCQNVTRWTKVSFIQGNPELTQVKFDEAQINHGDALAFVAPLVNIDGNDVGELSGWLITIDITADIQDTESHLEERIGTLVFDFGNDNEIIVLGGNTIHNRQIEMKNEFAQKRAIVGGTGIYKGISGEVSTTRNPDGTYLHELDYMLPL
jgi:hypothetical protein